MTSSNGNIFRVTGPLCGEFTGHRWIPCTKTSNAELWRFLYLCLYKRLSKQSRGWWFETPCCPLWRHSNGCGMATHPPRNKQIAWSLAFYLCHDKFISYNQWQGDTYVSLYQSCVTIFKVEPTRDCRWSGAYLYICRHVKDEQFLNVMKKRTSLRYVINIIPWRLCDMSSLSMGRRGIYPWLPYTMVRMGKDDA